MQILRKVLEGFAFIAKTLLCSETHVRFEISVWNMCIYIEPTSPLLKVRRPTLQPSEVLIPMPPPV